MNHAANFQTNHPLKFLKTMNHFINPTNRIKQMNLRVRLAILALPLVSFTLTASGAETEEVKRCFMFERADYVSLAGKEIPEFHKRKQITDTQKRSIKGEWVAIDRANKNVKFHRTDGKDFDIAMTNLAPDDRRYAELETGYIWQIDPLPTPVDIVKEDILAFDSMDDTHVHLRCVFPKNPSVRYVPKFQINLLTEKDRVLIKEKTGREFPMLPRPEPDRGSGAWKFPRPLFGHDVPKFTPSYYPETMRLMNKSYTPQEMVDAVRAHTMNSAFIHELNQMTFDEAEPERKAGTKSLAEILKIIGEVPSPGTEQKSIKPLIASYKLSMYEEMVPRDPAEPERFIRDERSILAQPGVPIDGELQAFQFMCQYLRLNSNMKKIPLSTLLENTKQSFSGVNYTSNGVQVEYPPEQRRKIYYSNDILTGIEKTYGYRSWKVFIPEKFRDYYKPGVAVRKFHDQLTAELIRQHIRDGKPVYARKTEDQSDHRCHGTQLVITGFKAEANKPLMFETISINGSIWGADPNTGEYQVTEAMVPESELDSMYVTFLERR